MILELALPDCSQKTYQSKISNAGFVFLKNSPVDLPYDFRYISKSSLLLLLLFPVCRSSDDGLLVEM